MSPTTQRKGTGYLLAAPAVRLQSPFAHWVPVWDNLSPNLPTQAETPAWNKTTRTELGKSAGAPVPNLLSEKQTPAGILRDPALAPSGTALDQGEGAGAAAGAAAPLTHQSRPGAARTPSLGGAGEGRNNRRAAQPRFTIPELEGAGGVPEPVCRGCPVLPHHLPGLFLQLER